MRRAAELAAVSPSTITSLERGNRVNPDTLRRVMASLHAESPIAERDVFELADAGKLSRAALSDYLRRVRPLQTQGERLDPSVELDRWRLKCHALVDRMLARAESPEQVETALVGMILAFESAMPDAPDGPMITKRGPATRNADGTDTQVTEHYQRRPA